MPAVAGLRISEAGASSGRERRYRRRCLAVCAIAAASGDDLSLPANLCHGRQLLRAAQGKYLCRCRHGDLGRSIASEDTLAMMQNAALPSPDEMQHAAALLREGKLVAFPTETVYGLGANALDC